MVVVIDVVDWENHYVTFCIVSESTTKSFNRQHRPTAILNCHSVDLLGIFMAVVSCRHHRLPLIVWKNKLRNEIRIIHFSQKRGEKNSNDRHRQPARHCRQRIWLATNPQRQSLFSPEPSSFGECIPSFDIHLNGSICLIRCLSDFSCKLTTKLICDWITRLNSYRANVLWKFNYEKFIRWQTIENCWKGRRISRAHSVHPRLFG